MSSAYLADLTARLTDGLARQSAEFRWRHATYLEASQNPDGGWSGREGDSDLYYTGFALRGLAVLDALTPEIGARAAAYLRQRLKTEASIVDFFSLLYACLLIQAAGGPDVLVEAPPDWPERVASTLESFRTADGGYGKATGAASGSTYHTFLVGLCFQLLGRSFPNEAAVKCFVESRRREDGGYVEIAPMKRSGTNPTAAAVGTLQLIGAMVPDGVASFLLDMASIEGGLRANGRIPLADLLSSFTGAWTLAQQNALAELNLEGLRTYVQGLETPAGGFRGGQWDEHRDVEYTFYGLGVMSLLS